MPGVIAKGGRRGIDYKDMFHEVVILKSPRTTFYCLYLYIRFFRVNKYNTIHTINK